MAKNCKTWRAALCLSYPSAALIKKFPHKIVSSRSRRLQTFPSRQREPCVTSLFFHGLFDERHKGRFSFFFKLWLLPSIKVKVQNTFRITLTPRFLSNILQKDVSFMISCQKVVLVEFLFTLHGEEADSAGLFHAIQGVRHSYLEMSCLPFRFFNLWWYRISLTSAKNNRNLPFNLTNLFPKYCISEEKVEKENRDFKRRWEV